MENIKHKKEFDLELAVKLAGLSQAAYFTPKSFLHKIRALGLGQYKYQLLENNSTQCYVVYSITEKKIFIAWRGTEVSEMEDILADLKFRKVVGHQASVHRGFKEYVDNVYPKLRNYIKEIINRNRDSWFDIYVTGHSLGGAGALISTNRLEDEEGFTIRCCYTYGGPRVGAWNFKDFVKTPVWRVRNNNDVVTKVPLAVMGFRHIGSLCYLSQRKKIFIGGKNAWGLFVDWLRGQFSRIGDGLRDHSVSEYYNILKEILDKKSK